MGFWNKEILKIYGKFYPVSFRKILILPKFELRFVGRVDDIILENLQNSSLKENLNLVGYIPHEQSVKEMENADMLLITNFPKQESAGIIPGKYLNTWLHKILFFL